MFDLDWGEIGKAFNWGDVGKSAVMALPQAVAAGVGSNMVARGNQAAVDIANQNRQQNLALLQPSLQQQGTAIEYMRGTMARRPQDLSPQQQIQLGDTRRQAVEMTPSSLRGSGRAQTAIINDVANRARAGMIAGNQQRSDTAAQTLGGYGANATNAMVGQNTATNNVAIDAATGTAGSNAQTMGNIASFFANAVKDRERESRYADWRNKLG